MAEQCWRCKQIIPQYEKVAEVRQMVGRLRHRWPRMTSYHLKCLPPLLFHQWRSVPDSHRPAR